MTSNELKNLTHQYVMNTYGRFPVAGMRPLLPRLDFLRFIRVLVQNGGIRARFGGVDPVIP